MEVLVLLWWIFRAWLAKCGKIPSVALNALNSFDRTLTGDGKTDYTERAEAGWRAHAPEQTLA